MKYKTLLFDLDGTILNTNELIINSFLYTLEQFYPGKYNREMIIPHMGKPLYEQMVIFGDESHAEEMVKIYREHNLRTHDEYVLEFPHVKEVLETLKQEGAILGVVTTKMLNTTMMGLKRFGMDSLMSTIVSYEDTEFHKPAPEPVLLAMERLGANPETTLMVGDSQYDIQAAKNAGITAIGVAWSLKGPEFLKQFDPDYVIKDMRDLIPIVRGIKEDEENKTISGERK
ncbi:pyrophosphatase PpaX [Tepidibacillus fermentans]|uniref:Pyrophosphatase PpaX n=1 Tax=Tepidibacillus fermentans TaxID=1281767 RepID=A0A4R3KFN0_9BACI|nr:pyrophosphatase PpaX [Tepidibacillus fermentans]TCS81809.1 pyrophosphatase PpaX [Tepidibacillus fermentans]